MKKRAAALFLALIFLWGCTAKPPDSPPPPESSSPPAPEAAEPWARFRDIAGESISPDSEDLTAISLSYTLGWVPWEEGYTRLERGMENGSAWVGELEAHYAVEYRKNSLPTLACDRSEYLLTTEDPFEGSFPVTGVLQADDRAVLFFPYREDPIRLYSLHPRKKEWEELYDRFCRRTTLEGETVEIQPVGIQFLEEDEKQLRALLPRDGMDQPYWADATLSFASVTVNGLSDGRGVEVFATRAVGDFRDGVKPESVTLGEEMAFSQVIGPEMQYWIYWGIPMEE